MHLRKTVLALAFLCMTGLATGEVTVGENVELGQPDNSATINVTQEFAVDSLTTYTDSTNFGGSNFSILQGNGDPVVVRLRNYNLSAGVGGYPANFSAGTSSSNNVTFEFTGFEEGSLYEAWQGAALLKRSESSASGVFDFWFDQFDSEYKSFHVQNIDNRVPEFNESTVVDDRKVNDLNLVLGLDDKGESDIASYSGSGTELEFTNSSLKLEKLLPISDTYTVTDFKGATSTEVLIDVSKEESNLREHDYQHTLIEQRVNKSITVSNGGDLDLNYDLEFQSHGTEVTGESWLATINSGSSSSHTGVWRGDWLDEQQYSFSPANHFVQLNQNYTGTRSLEIREDKGVEWTGVDTTGYVTSPEWCSQDNNTEVEVDASSTSNYSVGFDCDPGSIGEPTQTINNVSESKERVWYNSTDMQIYTNETEDVEIQIEADKGNLKNPDDRNGGSLTAYVEGSSSTNNNQLNVTDTGTDFRISVGEGFQESSLHTTDDSWSITYTLGGDSDSGGTGGTGGTGGGTEEQVADFVPEVFSVRYGAEAERSFTVENLRESETPVSVTVPDTEPCSIYQVATGEDTGEFGQSGEYTVSEAVLGQRQSLSVPVQVSMPEQPRFEELRNGNGTIRCELNTGSTAGSTNALVLEVEPGDDPLAPLKRFIDRIGEDGGIANLLNNLFVGVRGPIVVGMLWGVVLLSVYWRQR